MGTTRNDLLLQIDRAMRHLLRTVRMLTDADLQRPSLLPGWTRAHVLAHLALGADAMSHLLRGVRTGIATEAYPSQDARDKAIEAGAQWGAGVLLAELTAAAERFRCEVDAVPEHAWQRGVHVLGGAEFPAAEVLDRRLVEVVLHHTDLGAGYRPEDWPTQFARRDLAEPMRSQRRDRMA